MGIQNDKEIEPIAYCARSEQARKGIAAQRIAQQAGKALGADQIINLDSGLVFDCKRLLVRSSPMKTRTPITIGKARSKGMSPKASRRNRNERLHLNAKRFICAANTLLKFGNCTPIHACTIYST
jgi:hypothetical protein